MSEYIYLASVINSVFNCREVFYKMKYSAGSKRAGWWYYLRISAVCEVVDPSKPMFGGRKSLREPVLWIKKFRSFLL